MKKINLNGLPRLCLLYTSSLSFDVYVKKLLIEKLIDDLPEPIQDKKKK